jgi:hypothetical protein
MEKIKDKSGSIRGWYVAFERSKGVDFYGDSPAFVGCAPCTRYYAPDSLLDDGSRGEKESFHTKP